MHAQLSPVEPCLRLLIANMTYPIAKRLNTAIPDIFPPYTHSEDYTSEFLTISKVYIKMLTYLLYNNLQKKTRINLFLNIYWE